MFACSFSITRRAFTRKAGSFTLEDYLAVLVKQRLVEKSEAMLRAWYPEEFEKALAAG